MNPRLPDFLTRCASTVYPEVRTHGHDKITAVMAEAFAPKLPPGATVLDVGCGQGPALAWFKERGFQPVGIALGEDVAICAEKGFNVFEMDQNDLPKGWEESFEAVWARHVCEHSPIPYFTLCEFFRVLKPGGWLYVEVPADDTDAQHPSNQNHYSVMSERMWASLLTRAGFIGAETYSDIGPFPIGEHGEATDRYFAFIVQKPL